MFNVIRTQKILLATFFSLWTFLLYGPVVEAHTPIPSDSIALKESRPVTAGAQLHEYLWHTEHGPAKIFVIEVDLTHPYIHIDTMAGKGKITERLNVTAMARNNGAVAAINGDFYNMTAEGSPIGPMVMDGRLITSPIRNSGLYAFGITEELKAYIDSFTFWGTVKAPTGALFEISGLNKTFYRMNPDNSHGFTNRLQLYDEFWGGSTRGHDGLNPPTEMVLVDGQVIAFSVDEYYPGPIKTGMQILRGHGQAADFLLENFQIGDFVQIDYAFGPEVEWRTVLGGHSMLVKEGQVIPYAREAATLDGLRARTALGFSKDRQTLYLVGIEGRTEESKGLRLANLARFMHHIGSYEALNLDGGGSTTMAARPLGDMQPRQVFRTEQGTERLVVNGLGIFSTAPPGRMAGLRLTGNTLLLPSEAIAYQLYVYDEYYNPVDVATLRPRWQLTGTVGTLENNRLQVERSGQAIVEVAVENFRATLPIRVLGIDDIASIKIATTAKEMNLATPNQSVPLTLSLTTKEKEQRAIAPSMVEWILYNAQGTVSPSGQLTMQGTELVDGEFITLAARYSDGERYHQDWLLLQRQGDKLLFVDKKDLPTRAIGMELNNLPFYTDPAPYIKNERTLIPMRRIFEALRAEVSWNGEEQSVTAQRGDDTITLFIGSKEAYHNGELVMLDVAPEIYQDRTMIPLRFVSEALGATVEWDALNWVVRIFSDNKMD
ncbi:stalk domain-containing protein [Heliorestis convoluta]|uniref:Copper amine oxidase n=1 Tax=Heliorestis convoluta TaxID=356322 RepID=A0A5Q2MZF6_9FIRM|nr:stalk domain-containing protein [Heliorestis convoluta]QGG48364.1 hypothetical protein FTV88_2266 [Heliorestis convoluta]